MFEQRLLRFPPTIIRDCLLLRNDSVGPPSQSLRGGVPGEALRAKFVVGGLVIFLLTGEFRVG